MVDYQTLITHNHTIICVSLEEGLRYSLRAQHAEAGCHKKINLYCDCNKFKLKMVSNISEETHLINFKAG